MDDITKNLNLSKNLNKLLYEEINKNGKNNLNKLLNNGFFSKKLLTESYSPPESLLTKYRDFYYKRIAIKLFDEYDEAYNNVKFFKNANILKNPNYNFILFYQTGSTGDYSTISKLEMFKLPAHKKYNYTYNPSTTKWTYSPITTSSDGIDEDHYQKAIDELVNSAQTQEVSFGLETFRMFDQPRSTDWSISFPASKIFEGFDEESKNLLYLKKQIIKKM